ncbi:hypothetical protein KBB96_14405 [Luteolibacter ambystomatis]|uniref:PEGA domain-containing protein n=1 Tax=Luteolibacter ambystomatis TaxID=2824561 RepID=A0A975IZR8_9BACT|nr:hypothetical protein [Luteolibacter ambystomatis]QUE50055.1 hypothetical protein KBB96_14405 [Luteolibacter ambystomatis]
MKFKLFVCLPCVLFTSCATIVSKSHWPVTFNSNPSGAELVIKKENGETVHRGVTPTTLTLPSSFGYFRPAAYVVEVSKKGYPKQTLHIAANMNGWYMGNLILPGGLIGMLAVDPSSGAMWRLDESVTANLSPLASLDNGHGQKLHIVDRNTLPAEVQQKLVALN